MLGILTFVHDEVSRNKLEEIYYLYGKIMYYVSFDILKDHHEAEDVVQTAFLKISNHLEKIIDVKCNKTKGFVVIIVRNLSLTVYDQRKKKNTLPYEDLDHIVDERIETPEQYVLRLDQGERLAEQLAKLNPEYADLLTLKYFHSCENHEIAQLINSTEGNVRVKLYRARKALHHLLGGEEYGQTGK